MELGVACLLQTIQLLPNSSGLEDVLVGRNHILLNRYRSGDDTMGLHADDEPELGADPLVAIVSLGATRRLAVKPRRKRRHDRQDLDARPLAPFS
jgi:alkylated DNA repair dioxygenase AlkB